MAPDKIFLAFEHGFVAQTSTSKKDANGNSIFLSEYNPVEYIRKDSLLEWAKEQVKHNANKKVEDSMYEHFLLGKEAAYTDLIDKLDSM